MHRLMYFWHICLTCQQEQPLSLEERLVPPLDLFPWALESLQMVTAALKLKDACSL